MVGVHRNTVRGPLIDSDDLFIARNFSCRLRTRRTEIDIGLTGATGCEHLGRALRGIGGKVIKLGHEIDRMQLIPSMSSLVLIIPAAAVAMGFVFPESPHQANIIPHLDIAGLKVERVPRVERPKNIRVSVHIICCHPVTRNRERFESLIPLIPTTDFNLEVIPYKDIAIIWMPELAETILFNGLNDVSRVQDNSQRYNVPGTRPR
jgi:hypothetical protein